MAEQTPAGNPVKKEDLTPEAVAWEGMAQGNDYVDDVLHTQALNAEWKKREDAMVESNRERNEANVSNDAFDVAWKKQAEAMKETNKVGNNPNVAPNIPPTDVDEEADKLDRESERRKNATANNMGSNPNTNPNVPPVDNDVDEEAERLHRESERRRNAGSGYRSPRDNESDNPEEAAFAPGAGSEVPPRNTGGPENIDPNQSRPDDNREARRPAPTCFNPEATTFFGRMRDRAREMAYRIYDGLNEKPLAFHIVNRMKIAYNSIWNNRHEKKAVDLKGKLNASNLRIDDFNQSKLDMEAFIEDLHRQNMPGVESIQLRIKEMNQRISKELLERDEIQSKFEERKNKMKIYTDGRDRAANKLIGFYAEKLRPMESELVRLEAHRDRFDMKIVRAEIRHKRTQEQIQSIEDRKNRMAEIFSMTGMSIRRIRTDSCIRDCNWQIKQLQEGIQAEKDDLARKRLAINTQIAIIDERSNPYRDKREVLIRIKECKPLEMNVERRTRGENPDLSEDTQGHTRQAADKGAISTVNRNSNENAESAHDYGERLDVRRLVSDWNAYAEGNNMASGADSAVIDMENFSNITETSESEQWDFEDFRNMLEAYYKVSKNKNNRLKEVMDRYFQ